MEWLEGAVARVILLQLQNLPGQAFAIWTIQPYLFGRSWGQYDLGRSHMGDSCCTQGAGTKVFLVLLLIPAPLSISSFQWGTIGAALHHR